MKDVKTERADFVRSKNSEMNKIIDSLVMVAPFDATILLTGESGTGKSMLAEMIHYNSSRKDEPLITINCGAIPENLLESELFGYESGAFTGASEKGKEGLISTADKGTLFLDEIGDLSLAMQVKLLKTIQEKKVTRVGGILEENADFRLIAATNKDLNKLVQEGAFREDLFYRINVIKVELPPLRIRKEDIEDLIIIFTNKYNEKYSKHHKFSPKAIKIMKQYSWPGNVRELENFTEGMILSTEETVIRDDMLPLEMLSGSAAEYRSSGRKTLKEILEDTEKQAIINAYKKHGTMTKAAEALGISQASVSVKLRKYLGAQRERK